MAFNPPDERRRAELAIQAMGLPTEAQIDEAWAPIGSLDPTTVAPPAQPGIRAPAQPQAAQMREPSLPSWQALPERPLTQETLEPHLRATQRGIATAPGDQYMKHLGDHESAQQLGLMSGFGKGEVPEVRQEALAQYPTAQAAAEPAAPPTTAELKEVVGRAQGVAPEQVKLPIDMEWPAEPRRPTREEWDQMGAGERQSMALSWKDYQARVTQVSNRRAVMRDQARRLISGGIIPTRVKTIVSRYGAAKQVPTRGYIPESLPQTAEDWRNVYAKGATSLLKERDFGDPEAAGAGKKRRGGRGGGLYRGRTTANRHAQDALIYPSSKSTLNKSLSHKELWPHTRPSERKLLNMSDAALAKRDGISEDEARAKRRVVADKVNRRWVGYTQTGPGAIRPHPKPGAAASARYRKLEKEHARKTRNLDRLNKARAKDTSAPKSAWRDDYNVLRSTAKDAGTALKDAKADMKDWWPKSGFQKGKPPVLERNLNEAQRQTLKAHRVAIKTADDERKRAKEALKAHTENRPTTEKSTKATRERDRLEQDLDKLEKRLNALSPDIEPEGGGGGRIDDATSDLMDGMSKGLNSLQRREFAKAVRAAPADERTEDDLKRMRQGAL